MTELSKDQHIEALARENSRLYRDNAELRDKVRTLEADLEESYRAMDRADGDVRGLYDDVDAEAWSAANPAFGSRVRFRADL